jgi:hypothetical protein
VDPWESVSIGSIGSLRDGIVIRKLPAEASIPIIQIALSKGNSPVSGITHKLFKKLAFSI